MIEVEVVASEDEQLPDGLGFSSTEDGTGTLQGTPSDTTAAGDHTLKVIAGNGAYRAAVQEFSLTLQPVGTTSTTSTSTTSTSTTVDPSTSTTAPSSGPGTTAPNDARPTTERPGSMLDEAGVLDLPVAQLVSPAPHRGAPFEVRASGFTPGETVQVIVASTPTVLAEPTADDTGSIAITTVLPEGISDGPHNLATYGTLSDVGFRQPFVVAEAATVTTPDGVLPFTGGGSLPVLELGVVVAAAGAVLAGVAQRRLRRLSAGRR